MLAVSDTSDIPHMGYLSANFAEPPFHALG
jgi:hypothetical protein